MRAPRLVAVLVALASCAPVASSSGPTPSASTAAAPSDSNPTSPIDAALESTWAERGITPAEPISDDAYLRRVSIDLIGRIPSIEELRAFQAESAPDRRARAVKQLLASPEHARHLARVWDRLLLGPEVKNKRVDRGALRRWLERRFADDAPWDVIVRDLVAAEGTTSVGGSIADAVVDASPERGAREKDLAINGAANFPLRYALAPQDMAGRTSSLFLGVQIQCAQCHDHKTEKWTRDDFRGMAASFAYFKPEPREREKKQVDVFEVKSIEKPARRLEKNADTSAYTKVAPRALDGTDLSKTGDPRRALAAWITSPRNPWFAKAMVNRVFADLMGTGFIEPVDDLRPASEVVAPAVLDALASGFVDSRYDLDWLYATICTSKAYDRQTKPGPAREAAFSHASLRALSADELLDSILVATDGRGRLAREAPDKAARIETRVRRSMGFVFDDDAESNADGYDGTLQQAFFSMNGALPIAAASVAPGSLLEDLLAHRDDAAIVDELYLRAFSRRPRAEETQRALAALARDTEADPGLDRTKNKKAGVPPRALRSSADDARERGFEDLFWALLNASELAFRR